jgi:predicted Ser/Thr protein kinase
LDTKPSSTPPPVPSGGELPQGDGDPLIGAVLLDRVRIVRPLARGGMGKVYFGEQTGLNRPCAVKVLDPRLAAADAGDFTKRFLLEASVASKLTHSNVVTVFDYGETPDGSCFIAMEYLDGRTLADELKNGRLSPERAVHITRQVCRALREAHALAVVHRDVKPGNVFLIERDEDKDFVKVLDFGLVGEVQTQEAHEAQGPVPIMGSPRYMAPEQVQGKAADARTDVYAVGAMLYAMLAGRPPFERATDLATMMAQVSDAPPPLATAAPGLVLPAGLEGVVMKCLAKDPDHRYGSMDELIAALKLQADGSLAASESGPGVMPDMTAPRPPRVPSPLAPQPRRGVAPVAVAAVCAAVVFGVFGASELRRRIAPPAVASPAPATADAPVLAPAASAAPKATATVHLETTPPGAKVKEEGETLCEATPCDVVYTGEGAAASFEHLVVFMKPDYKLERKLVTVGASPVRVKLTRAK